MESTPQRTPILQKPPGYRDPAALPPRPHPPRKPKLPPSFRPKPKRRSCFRICCCTCCLTLLIVILVAVIAGGLFYLFFDPSLPEFHLGSFRILKLNITEKAEGAFIDVETATRVEIKNRNGKMVWWFEQSSFSISALNGDLNLGSTTVPAFTVKENDVKELKAETRVKDQALNENQRRKVKGAFETKALVPSVEVRTKTGVGMNGWNSASISITLLCGDVTIRQLENGEMPKCTVSVLKWIKFR